MLQQLSKLATAPAPAPTASAHPLGQVKPLPGALRVAPAAPINPIAWEVKQLPSGMRIKPGKKGSGGFAARGTAPLGSPGHGAGHAASPAASDAMGGALLLPPQPPRKSSFGRCLRMTALAAAAAAAAAEDGFLEPASDSPTASTVAARSPQPSSPNSARKRGSNSPVPPAKRSGSSSSNGSGYKGPGGAPTPGYRGRGGSANNDGAFWRKYGEKVVKGGCHPRSYYRCTEPNCPARKMIDRDVHTNAVLGVVYKGKHTHPLD